MAMASSIFLLLAASFFQPCSCAATVQGDCVNGDNALSLLAKELSSNSVISCLGSPLQQYNAGRYWGTQYGKNASVVVFPATTNDLSLTVQATSNTHLGQDFAFVGGAHGMTNASSSNDFVIDLSYLNGTQIIPQYEVDGNNITAISYQGGATWIDVTTTTGGSGYTAVGARVSSVGVGGFSTGGGKLYFPRITLEATNNYSGIGFLAGAEGYAIDRLRAMEVVLPSGQVVMAAQQNNYSDLFWALQGGGGQFGIVATFFQEAAREPGVAVIGAYFVDDASLPKARQHVVDWFHDNNDPFSLVYFLFGFLPSNIEDPNPDPTTFASRTLLVTLWMENPYGSPGQQPVNATFAKLLHGLNTTVAVAQTVPYQYLSLALDPVFPYGFRRGFYGPQTTKITTQYLTDIQDEFSSYIQTMLAHGEFPATALWCIQYMSPGLNGHLPSSNAATGWPHAVAGHQTLFSPVWESYLDDSTVNAVNDVFNNITHTHQKKVGPKLADYPNYVSPDATGKQVYGENLARLEKIKQKYDPMCRIHNGRVFASKGCVEKGYANVFPD